MHTKSLTAALAAAVVTLVTIGCKDIPLLPKWSADWNIPLPSQRIPLQGPFPAIVPAGASAHVSFPPQALPIDGAIGQLLKSPLSNASIFMVVTKSIPLNGQDTLFVAATVADLSNPAATRIVVPIALTAGNAQDSVQSPVSAAGLAMLQSVANSSGSLQVQLSGQVTYPGPGTRTITLTDSIGVRLGMLSTIAVSR